MNDYYSWVDLTTQDRSMHIVIIKANIFQND